MADFSCLIVEDSPMMRQLLVFALARVKNLRVTEADDGVDGLRKLAAAKFDIIITDINMPIMDGMECVKAIRALGDKKKSNLPVVAITGNAKNYSEEEFKAAGFNDVLVKPLNFDRLVEIVNDLTEE